MGRVLTWAEVGEVRGPLRQTGQVLVFTNGCFDLLHVGHLDYLERARELGDALWVGLNDDASVRTLKGAQRPLIPWEERARLLAALGPVDAVIGFGETRADRVLALVRPEVYVKGGDYTVETLPEAATAVAVGAQVCILPLVPSRSTSQLIATIVARYGAPQHP